MKKTAFIFMILTFIGRCLCATNPDTKEVERTSTALKGRVVDASKLPIPGATILLAGTNVGTVTDVDGFFRINNLNTSTVDMEVHYIGYQTFSLNVDLKEGETTRVNVQLTEGLALDEVKVKAHLQGQVKAINQQKSSNRIINVVSSDQTSRFPDENIGDALKRIPGVSIQTDMGEARFGHIRGTSPEYNSVTINGDRMPSAEAENRSNQLDLIPADMVQTIEVSKVITSDMEGDAIGGAVNLITKSSPYKRRLSGSVVSGYNFGSEKAPVSASLLYGDRFAHNKIGVVLSASYQNNHTVADNIEAEWEREDDKSIYTSDFQMRQYLVQRERQSYSAAFDFDVNEDHSIKVKGLYNRRKDWENRFRLQYKNIELNDDGQYVGELRRQTKGGSAENKDRRLEDQQNMNVSLGGEHHFGGIELTWKTSYAKANEERPNERYLTYRNKNQTLTTDFKDTEHPFVSASANENDLSSSWSLKELTEEFQWTEDQDINARLDLTIPLSTGKNDSKIKLGGRMKWKDKERNNQFYEYEPTNEDAFTASSFEYIDDKSKSNYGPGEKYQTGHFVSEEYLGGLDLANTTDFEGTTVPEEMAVNFNATEQVTAGYVRFDQEIGDMKLVAGLRAEKTDVEYQGFEYDIDNDALIETAKEKSDYVNWLPSLILKYEVSDHWQWKAAYSNTIARPKYWALVPYKNVSLEDNNIEIGNPNLKPTTSMNLDLMSEFYFGATDAFSIGVFYKDIQDFIVEQEKRDYQFEARTWDKFKQDINGGNAALYGIEASLQKQLNFLGGLFAHFSLYGNYTYNHAEVSDFNIDDREGEDLPLPGTPEHTFNASLAYGKDKVNLRASFNYASAFIDELGSEAFYDRYYDKVTYLDVNGSYNLNKNWIVFAEVNNVLNQPLRYYQGDAKFTMQEEYYGMKAQIGIKANF